MEAGGVPGQFRGVQGLLWAGACSTQASGAQDFRALPSRLGCCQGLGGG
jgi:hypothetical protein